MSSRIDVNDMVHWIHMLVRIYGDDRDVLLRTLRMYYDNIVDDFQCVDADPECVIDIFKQTSPDFFDDVLSLPSIDPSAAIQIAADYRSGPNPDWPRTTRLCMEPPTHSWR